jgi:hypothetical protein
MLLLDNTINKITPLDPGMSVTLANNGTSLKAGEANLLVLSSMAAGIALDGALLHARTSDGIPVGSYKDTGGIFVDFPGCGKTKEGVFNGVVHSDLITCNVRRPLPHLSLLNQLQHFLFPFTYFIPHTY